MAKYITYAYYTSLYGNAELEETEFNRLVWDAEREIDKATSGIDNVKKLRVAFPTNEEDAEIVKRCICGLVNFLHEIEQAEKNANSLWKYTELSDGSLKGKVISSVSAGSESIGYSVGKNADTSVVNATKSMQLKEKEIYSFISGKLSGITDANGVYLLYTGRYLYYTEE